MGKTSALEAAAARVRRKGGAVVVADLSTGSTVADIANRNLLRQRANWAGPGKTWSQISPGGLRRE